MKKLFGIFLATLVVLTMAVAASAADVYVTDGGTGDGSSVTAALGDMTAAIEKVANGGTVHIVGAYTCADEYHEPAHKGDIVIEGGRYIFTNGKYNRWFLSGPGATTFENVTFEYGEGNTSLFIAQFNKLVFGEGLVFPAGKCYVVGGYQYAEGDETQYDLTKDSDVTVKSGNLWCVSGFSRGNSLDQYTGTSHIRIEGGEIGTVYGAAINGSYAGNGVIDMVGGTVNNLRAGGDATRRINNCEINISGGMVGTLSINNVLERCVVNFTGGVVGNAEKTVSESVQEFVTDGTAVLNYSSNVNAKLLALFFDESNVIGGGATPAVTEAPAKTEAASETAAPAETTGAEDASADGEETAETTAAVETADAADTEAAAQVTEEVPATKDVAAPAETETATDGAVAKDNGGAPVGLIIGAIALVAVIAAVVVVLVKKKKN
ncbi:MAG: hypothetical protein IJS44_03145 [Clostridia bacterium]|nr:hypothetical protein [Clostridia bacterium]